MHKYCTVNGMLDRPAKCRRLDDDVDCPGSDISQSSEHASPDAQDFKTPTSSPSLDTSTFIGSIGPSSPSDTTDSKEDSEDASRQCVPRHTAKVSCLKQSNRHSCRSSRRKVSFSQTQLDYDYETYHLQDEAPRVTHEQCATPFTPEALTKSSLLAMEEELGAEFRAQNAASLQRLKRRVRLVPLVPVPRPYANATPIRHRSSSDLSVAASD